MGADAVVTAVEAPRVLIVEDDRMVSDVVARYLQLEGFVVDRVEDGGKALQQAAEHPPDLVVLDIMLPGIDGLEVCRRLRSKSPVPIIMLTALGEETERVTGLELGADDYVAKPFSPRELTARVKSVLRRARSPLAAGSPELTGPLTFDGLKIDLTAHEVLINDKEVTLTAREFELLVFFALRSRQVFTREDLLLHVWGYSFGDASTVTVHVRRLREKIEADPAKPKRIVTVWGVGYRFEP